MSTRKGPISCVAPYPTEEHPGPETLTSCHLTGEQATQAWIKQIVGGLMHYVRKRKKHSVPSTSK